MSKKHYPLSKEELSVYLASVMNPDRALAYLIGFSLHLPLNIDREKLKTAFRKVFEKHRILNARIGSDENGYYKYDSEEEIVIEQVRTDSSSPDPSGFIEPLQVEGGRLYRIVLAEALDELLVIMYFSHVIEDGTGREFLLKDLAAAFRGEDIGRESFTAFDYALREEEERKTKAFSDAKEYYARLLDGVEYTCPEPDRWDDQEKFKCLQKPFARIDGKALKALKEKAGVRTSTIFLASVGYCISLFSGTQHSVITSAATGRGENYKDSSGMFVRTIPMVLSADNSLDVVRYLKELDEQTTKNRDFSMYTYYDMVNDLGASAKVVFAYQGDMAENTVFFDGEQRKTEPLHTYDSDYEMRIYFWRMEGTYLFEVLYRADHYSEEYVSSLAETVEQVLLELTGAETLGDMDLCSHQLSRLDSLRGEDAGYEYRDVVSGFLDSALKFPERTAVICGQRTLTYKMAEQISGKIALKLKGQGIGKGDVAAILVPRSEYMPLAALGVLRSGACYQPLDPTYPPERLKFMMEDAGIKLLISTKELISKCVPDYSGDVLLTEEIESLPSGPYPAVRHDESDPFVILYTSGSTGVPKGVILEHRNISAFCYWYRRFYHMDKESVSSAYASFGFDANIMDMYPALSTGAAVDIIEEEIRLNFPAIAEEFRLRHVTHSFMTTQVGRQFAGYFEGDTLKCLSVGGEKLTPVFPDKSFRFYNGYGPSECTVFTTIFEVDRLYHRVPIGKPLDTVRLYVVDNAMRRLPVGVPGELLISGPQVARGYLNRPEKNAEVFIDNPFTEEPAYQRMFRSGDTVRILPDGNIDFIGRHDGQVKVRGFRIELTEIEAVIRQFPGIEDATVQTFEDESSGELYIAAYVVSGSPVDISALHAFIRREKPPYMVPSVTMQIEKIPLNQNQKVNKKMLPKPERSLLQTDPPENETQQAIFDCAAEVLGYKEFGIRTDLSEAGLSSIGSIRLSVMLDQAFQMPFAASDLKEHNTVEKLEQFILGRKGSGKNAQPEYPVLSSYPLSKTQEGIYVECIKMPDSTLYNIPVLLKIDPALDTERLRKAIASAVNAHPFIKTRLFLEEDGEVKMRRMDGDFSFDAESVLLRTCASEEEILNSPMEPFHLIGGRLFRISIIDTAEKNRYLFLEMHHIISDGTSVGILLNDISKAYEGINPETEVFTGYEVVQSEEELRKEGKAEEEKQYYADLLQDTEMGLLPTGDVEDKTAEPDQPGAGGFLHYDAKLISTDALKKFCKEQGLSLNAYVTAAFGHLLNAYLNTEGIAFAGIYNGRSDSRYTRTVAMLVKTIPIVTRALKEDTVAGHVRAVQRQLTDTQAKTVYSFAEICRQLGMNADVMFAYQGEDFLFDTFCAKESVHIPVPAAFGKAPLNMKVSMSEGFVSLDLEYDTGRYSGTYAKELLQNYEQVLSKMLCTEYMRDISFLTEEQSAQLDRFNATDAPLSEGYAPERLEQAARKWPDRTAVIYDAGTASMSYSELNTKARKIAAKLIQSGARKNSRIGLYMNRTGDVYAIREGIMKAHAAFVNLEPEYPDERIAFILEDAGIEILITTKQLSESRKQVLSKVKQLLFVEEIYASGDPEDSLFNTETEDCDLAYCIYTSGSTGKPKGVEITHKNLRNLLDYNEKNTLAHAYVDHSSVFLAIAAITFDVSIIEEMMPMYHGHPVVIATEEEIHNPLLLAETVIKTGADMMKCTPSYMLSVLDIPQALRMLKQMKAIIFGAEPFPKGLYEKMRSAGFEGKIFNSYGPTETCVSVSIGDLKGSYATIGGPCANIRFFLMDRYGNLLPKHMRGELIIAGDCTGGGYINLPEQTGKAFFRLNMKNASLPAYRSGDIAYYNARGEIMHCGRNDDQIKIRGLRVELGGIENTMNTLPGIERSVVLALGEGDGKYLVGYYAAKEPVEERTLIDHLRKTLPAYMVPGVYVRLEKIPLTINGKVDKRALPKPAPEKKAGTAKAEAMNELQQKIAELFTRAIGADKIGLDEDFFEIGGTSLLASRIAMGAMLQHLPIAYQDVFAHPTVRKMEEHVRAMQEGAERTKTPDMTKAEHPVKEDSGEEGRVQEVLSANCMENIEGVTKGYQSSFGTVLLTGATGFLGAHVLWYLLEHTEDKVICLIRKGSFESCEKRLRTILMYYFDSPCLEEFERGRITVADGDITDPELVERLSGQSFDIVINCAACVKHFSNDDILERVNVDGVKNLIRLCSNTGKRLIQISTVSVAGENVNHALSSYTFLDETRLWLGQDLSNKYINSKFKAEQAVLEAIAQDRLDGKIIRVGNLMGRSGDGEFQINYVTSGFMRNLRGYAAIGAFPVSRLAKPVEFSPIDQVARAVVTLAGTAKEYTVFHAVNGHWIEMGDVIYAMNQTGIYVREVTDAEFQKALNEAMADEKKNMLISGLISYLSSDAEVTRSYVPEDHTFTKNVLYRLGFRWALTDENYLTRSIEALKTIGFFDGEL